MNWVTHTYKSDEQLVDVLANDIAGVLRQAIAKRGKASLVVSGGSTPSGLFTKLSRVDLDWAKVAVSLVDERWVPEDHPDSNAGLVKSALLQDKAASAKFVGLKTNQPDPSSAVLKVNDLLKALPYPLDAVVLGMGEDGHTASFFPDSKGTQEALDKDGKLLCSAVFPQHASHARMTLTLPTILAGRNLYLQIIGRDKKVVLERAMAEGGNSKLPIASVLQHSPRALQIYYAEHK